MDSVDSSINQKEVRYCKDCGEVCPHKCKSSWNKGKIGFYGGWTLSDETKARMRQSNPRYWKGKSGSRLGQKHSEESKAKMRVPKTEEHKAKLRGRRTPEHTKNWVAARHRNGTFIATKQWREAHSDRMTGEKNPNWKGGLSFIPYPTTWTPALRRKVKERDNYTCQICRRNKDIKLEVHHIDYVKANCTPENLTTLCCSCHKKTNFNRETWITFFKKAA